MNIDLNSYAQRQAVVQHDHILSFLALANMTADREALLALLDKLSKDPMTPRGRQLVDAAIAFVKEDE